MSPVPAHARGEIPSDKVLAELRVRLLEKPACLPQCAQIPHMRLDVGDDMIRLRMEIHALADVAVPLPGRPDQWQARSVFVGGQAIRDVFRDDVGRQWQQPTGISGRFIAPVVGLGIESVNSSIKVIVPRNRWVLFTGGPRLGPAVLFWGLFIVIALVAFILGRIGRTPLRTVHWMLLGLGLTQVPVFLAVVVVGWLFALSARKEIADRLSKGGFNLMQIGLGLLTVAALGVLYFAVRQGLLGWPNMYIAGNGSSSYVLQWFQDRAGLELPRPWALSLPTSVYRVLMLVWALWLALALLRWLRWGWDCFSVGGIWRTVSFTWRGTGSEPAGPAAPDKAET